MLWLRIFEAFAKHQSFLCYALIEAEGAKYLGGQKEPNIRPNIRSGLLYRANEQTIRKEAVVGACNAFKAPNRSHPSSVLWLRIFGGKRIQICDRSVVLCYDWAYSTQSDQILRCERNLLRRARRLHWNHTTCSLQFLQGQRLFERWKTSSAVLSAHKFNIKVVPFWGTGWLQCSKDRANLLWRCRPIRVNRRGQMFKVIHHSVLFSSLRFFSSLHCVH